MAKSERKSRILSEVHETARDMLNVELDQQATHARI